MPVRLLYSEQDLPTALHWFSTKKGKAGKPVITLNSNLGTNKLVNQPHLLNVTEFLHFRADAMLAKASFDSTP